MRLPWRPGRVVSNVVVMTGHVLTEDHLRAVLGHFATGVTVVTSRGPQGYLGMTVNSFTSVSLSPPLVLVCVRRGSATGLAIEAAGVFAVNVLCEDQMALSQRFCGPQAYRFMGVEVAIGWSGAPLLNSALACLECRVEHGVDAGDHRILIGRVLTAECGDEGGEKNPLVFFRGVYR
jgi:flavin reductase (DIM6/NTAB) family NADH-FMN oxidoreductase RutF